MTAGNGGDVGAVGAGDVGDAGNDAGVGVDAGDEGSVRISMQNGKRGFFFFEGGVSSEPTVGGCSE